MKRLKKFTVNPDSYLATDIDPLLDELEALRGAEEFPKFNDFVEWATQQKTHPHYPEVYNYFAQFKTRTIEVMPEVGREYEFSNDGHKWYNANHHGFISSLHSRIFDHIRPIATPNRDEVIKRAKELGLSEAELEVLCNTK
jgi:hypothetical protein